MAVLTVGTLMQMKTAPAPLLGASVVGGKEEGFTVGNRRTTKAMAAAER